MPQFWDSIESKVEFSKLAARLADKGLGFMCLERDTVIALPLTDI